MGKKTLLTMVLVLAIASIMYGQVTYTLDKPRFFYFKDNVAITITCTPSVIDSVTMDQEVGKGIWMDGWLMKLYGTPGIVSNKYHSQWFPMPVQVEKLGTIVDDPKAGFNMGDTMMVKMIGYKSNVKVDSVLFGIPVGYSTSISQAFSQSEVSGSTDVFDVTGKLLGTYSTTQLAKNSLLQTPSGFYILRITDAETRQVGYMKVSH